MAKTLIRLVDLKPGQRITQSHLFQAGACLEQRRLFKRTFPKGLLVGRPDFVKAFSVGLSLVWLLTRLNLARSLTLARWDNLRQEWLIDSPWHSDVQALALAAVLKHYDVHNV